VVGEVHNIRIENDVLLGDVKTFREHELANLECRPRFLGQIDKNGIATELELISFGFTNDPA
jgi:hypothetical protein